MADKKSNTPSVSETEKQIAELELRIAKLEAKQAGQRIFGDLFKDGAPSQDEVRDWIKANPFMAVGIAAATTALLALIF